MEKDLIEYDKKELVRIIQELHELKINPPWLILDQTEIEKQYWALEEENKKFKKLFWRFYYK